MTSAATHLRNAHNLELNDISPPYYNCLTTSQAPTGSVSTFLRNSDTGIEPFFDLSITRKVRDPETGWESFTLEPYYLADLFEKYPEFRERAEAQTALKLSPDAQLDMLGAFQQFIHTGVSKTINLPANATVEDIKRLIYKARDMNLKGFTVYRDTSLDGVLTTTPKVPEKIEITAPKVEPHDIGPKRNAVIYTAKSSTLKAHITLAHDNDKNIREVFIAAGHIGANINAIFTALGMIISTSLRHHPSLFDAIVKVLCKINMDQRFIIDTSTPPIVGNSLPQALGLLLQHRKEELQEPSQDNQNLIPPPKPMVKAYDICPSCHELTLKREGACMKCNNCGYSSC
jgi:ribonucleoside-diphosphate reductase alpha chain